MYNVLSSIPWTITILLTLYLTVELIYPRNKATSFFEVYTLGQFIDYFQKRPFHQNNLDLLRFWKRINQPQQTVYTFS